MHSSLAFWYKGSTSSSSTIYATGASASAVASKISILHCERRGFQIDLCSSFPKAVPILSHIINAFLTLVAPT